MPFQNHQSNRTIFLEPHSQSDHSNISNLTKPKANPQALTFFFEPLCRYFTINKNSTCCCLHIGPKRLLTCWPT